MCGPITCMFMGKSQSKMSVFMYHFSRLLSYSLVVFILTIIGSLTVKNMIWNRFSDFILWALIAFASLQVIKHFAGKKISNLFPSMRSSKAFPAIIGSVTGLLPCGLLIPAYIGASSMPSKTLSILAIFYFFAGTLPALLMSQTIIHKVKKTIPDSFQSWVNPGLGIIFLLVQIWMITK
jgi:sulfite exporter TauE/SafE